MQDILKKFSFSIPTKLEYENNYIKNLGKTVSSYDRILIITDEGLIEAGILETVKNHIADKKYSIYSDIGSNPKDYQVEEGAEIAHDFNPDLLLAVGGGSPIDCAKGIEALISKNEESISELYGKRTISKKKIPFIAVPTTAGSGSEVTFSAVITDTDTRVKKSIRSKNIAPDLSLLDPSLTVSLPEDLTAFSGMDAFTHAIEAFTAKTSTVVTNALAIHSMKLILKNLEKAVNDPEDIEARGGMLLGSTLAGISFNNSDVASVHCMAESLGGKYDAPHGFCNSIILPFVMEHNKDYCAKKYAKVAQLMGLDYSNPSKGAEKAIEKIRKINQRIGIDAEKMQLKKEDIGELAERSVDNLSNESNPKPMDKEDYVRLFYKILEEKEK